jgi:hypothetical protein
MRYIRRWCCRIISSNLADEMVCAGCSAAAVKGDVRTVSKRLLSRDIECCQYGRVLQGEVYKVR